MSEEKRFVCIDVGYGDEWYITDNGERLSEMEIVDLLNEQQSIIHRDEISIKTMMSNMKKLEEENEQLKRQNIQSKREESLNLKDYVETDERGHIVKVKLVDYIDDLIYERLNKKLEG